jgi:ABC-type spermidine/putrescine transport system permease subunit II
MWRWPTRGCSSATAPAGRCSPERTLPMVIFSKVRLGVSPEVNALATIIVGVVAFGVIVATWQMRRAVRDAG